LQEPPQLHEPQLHEPAQLHVSQVHTSQLHFCVLQGVMLLLATERCFEFVSIIVCIKIYDTKVAAASRLHVMELWIRVMKFSDRRKSQNSGAQLKLFYIEPLFLFE
jgi:hypothetical protein